MSTETDSDRDYREAQLALLRIATRLREIAPRAGRDIRPQLIGLADNIRKGVVSGDAKRICARSLE